MEKSKKQESDNFVVNIENCFATYWQWEVIQINAGPLGVYLPTAHIYNPWKTFSGKQLYNLIMLKSDFSWIWSTFAIQ